MKRKSRQHEATYSEVKRLLIELPFYWLNSNLQMKLIKDRADFINNGTARYIADAFNIINVDINAQTISFSVGGPTCCALAQKILSNNKYYCSMIFF